MSAKPEIIQFYRKINGLCIPARREAEARVRDPSITSIGCIDEFTFKGDWNIPGSAVLLFLERPDLLRLLISLHPNETLTFYTHTCCGLKFAKGYRTVEAQSALVEEFRSAVTAWGKEFRCNIIVVVENVGSARPYMEMIAAD